MPPEIPRPTHIPETDWPHVCTVLQLVLLLRPRTNELLHALRAEKVKNGPSVVDRLGSSLMEGVLALPGDRETTPEEIEANLLGFATTLLEIFDGDRPQLWRALDSAVGYASPVPGAAGRRFAEAVSDAAWRLYLPRAAVRAADEFQQQLAAHPDPEDQRTLLIRTLGES
jgi:hypothetical protein